MVASAKLKLIGYWGGPSAQDWPNPHEFVDPSWDRDERETVREYLEDGFVLRAFGGISRCRFCDQPNGALERTDGQWYWPDGLAHYLAEHDVRLPQSFVDHVLALVDRLEVVEREVEWWRSQSGCRPAED
ncbi:hypothetical protein [Kribbella italica]|uniref:Uncharacterized protein n=1 Tax=Kribbella italica TaxID=1540520 RepID=A0A7W9J7G2_9ACTN|nr:hypothetical protein [Kribbella italica]MBB5836293.1 hypothetical protein [Kribbella italica]